MSRPTHLNAVFGLDLKLNPLIPLAGLVYLSCLRSFGWT